MTDKQQVPVGTIGRRPCEQHLARILNERGDRTLTRKATGLLHKAREEVHKLQATCGHDRAFYTRLLVLLRRDWLGQRVAEREIADPAVLSHVKASLDAEFRDAAWFGRVKPRSRYRRPPTKSPKPEDV